MCVELEGTLIRSNLLLEGCLRYTKRNLLFTLYAVRWLILGRARLKSEIASRESLEIELLPANTALLTWLEAEHEKGRRLILCTGANQAMAERAAAHFGIFDSAMGGDSARNLSARAKASLLRERFGSGGFDYAGSKLEEMPIWKIARRAIVVSPTFDLQRHSHLIPALERVFQESRRPAMLWFRALRIHQWAKNLLIFIPVLASHRALEPTVAASALLAFIWFSVCASGTYLINDLLDLDADRAHSRKRFRPLASGELPLGQGITGALLLIVTAIVGAVFTLGPLFVAILVLYLVGTLWYSLSLKRMAMVDVLTLAGLYTVRVIAGGAAIAVIPSFWLLAFSVFLFLSLAMAKRHTELRSLLSTGRSMAAGRGYTVDDLPLLLACGTSAAFVSVLVLAFYINVGANELYRYPQALWLLCPLLLYWICRVWLKAHRGELHDDPIVFALKDRPSLAVACLCGLLVWVAS